MVVWVLFNIYTYVTQVYTYAQYLSIHIIIHIHICIYKYISSLIYRFELAINIGDIGDNMRTLFTASGIVGFFAFGT